MQDTQSLIRQNQRIEAAFNHSAYRNKKRKKHRRKLKQTKIIKFNKKSGGGT